MRIISLLQMVVENKGIITNIQILKEDLAIFRIKPDTGSIPDFKAGQFATLLKEKVGLEFKTVIKQYDGRPFDPIDLANKIKEVL